MYMLTCPECGNKSKVRSAKVGVTAGCSFCDNKYKLEASNIEKEEENSSRESAVKTTKGNKKSAIDTQVLRALDDPEGASQEENQISSLPPMNRRRGWLGRIFGF